MYGQPRLRRHNQGLHACLQSRMNDWCKTRVMVGWKRAEFPLLLCLGIHCRIISSEEPVHCWNIPSSSKATEVLARHCGLCLFYGTGGEAQEKCINDLLCRISIVPL